MAVRFATSLVVATCTASVLSDPSRMLGPVLRNGSKDQAAAADSSVSSPTAASN